MCSIISRKGWLLAGVVLLTAAMSLHGEESARGQELRRRLSDTIDFHGIEDARATLNDALDMLAKRYNLTFDINDEAFKEANLQEIGRKEIVQTTPIQPMHTRIDTILRKILSRVSPSATFFIRGDTIELTTAEAIRKEFFADRPETPGPLPPLVSGSFDKVPLEAALKELNHYGNVVLDARTAKEAQAPVTAELSNMPLDTAARLFADMAGLKVVQLDNALYVTSIDNARDLRQEQEKSRLHREREIKAKPSDGGDKDKQPAPKPVPPKAETESGKKSS